jgi:hypothetical protein
MDFSIRTVSLSVSPFVRAAQRLTRQILPSTQILVNDRGRIATMPLRRGDVGFLALL